MATYPVYLPRDTYRGKQASRQAKASCRNQAASKLEAYINERLIEQQEEQRIYFYAEISSATGVPLALVSELCFGIDGGHNDFRAKRVGV